MDSFEVNKIAGAVLFCILVILGLNNLGNILIKPKKLAENAYHIDVPDAPEPGKGAKTPAAAEPDKPVALLLASADVKKGEASFKKCATCHTPEKGGANKVGPNLFDIVGSNKARTAGFAYSSGMQGKGGAWTYDEIYAFIKDPKAFVPGTKMSFAGIKKSEERADIIAYLRGLSDAPKPLPTN